MNNYNISDYEILTPLGWSKFDNIRKTVKREYCLVKFTDNTEIKCSTSHKFKSIKGDFKYIVQFNKNDKIIGNNKNKIIKSIKIINEEIELYDLINVEKNHEYYTNGIISKNCAFIPNINDIWTSAQPTLSLGGKACLLSTPYGTATFFHKMWVEAEAGSNGFKPIKLPWYLHPERDKKWRDEQTLKVGEKQAAQENDCDFITTGATVIPLQILQKYEKDKNFIRDPIEKRGQRFDLWIWERVQPGKQYIVSADCARGDGEDNSAFHVLDVKTMEQVAEYRGKLTTKLYGDLLVAIATEYNDALLIIENNNIGWATIQQVIDRNYNNLFYSSANLTLVDTEKSYTYNWSAEDRKKVAGFATTNQNRQLLINNMGLLVCNMEISLHSQRLINELTTFVWKDGKAQAMKGHNDDLVMAYAIGLWIRNTALRIMSQERTYQEAMLKAFRVSTMRADQFKDAKKSFNTFNNLENNLRLYDKNYAQSTWDYSIRENMPQQAMINSFYRPNVLGVLNSNQNNNIFDLRELL